jgi:hypothetical protein
MEVGSFTKEIHMFSDKSIFKSLTAWGGVVFAAATSAEAVGMIPTGVSAAAVTVVQAIAALVALLGLRRAVGATS